MMVTIATVNGSSHCLVRAAPYEYSLNRKLANYCAKAHLAQNSGAVHIVLLLNPLYH